jgi:peroxiredoxin
VPQIALNSFAPDFELADFNGKLVRLSDQIGRSNVLLVFNRGFV